MKNYFHLLWKLSGLLLLDHSFGICFEIIYGIHWNVIGLRAHRKWFIDSLQGLKFFSLVFHEPGGLQMLTILKSIYLLQFTAVKLVYLLLCVPFPTKISNSVDESWEIKINIHFSPTPMPPWILRFSEGMFGNSVPSAVLTQSYSLWFWQVYLITVSVIIGHLTLKVFIVTSAEIVLRLV